MLKSALLSLALTIPLASSVHAAPTSIDAVAAHADELEDLILVPFQGTWRQGANTFVIAHGDTRDDQGFVGGNLVGGNGTVSRYWWKQTSQTRGYFYFDTTQGRQGPVYVELLNNNNTMRWQFGAETMILNKV